MRVVGVGHGAFAIVFIALGIMGLVTGDFTPVWAPVSKGVPLREALVYLCSVISILCGAGIVVEQTAASAARVLFVYLSLWLLVFRVPVIFKAQAQQDPWSGLGETAVVVAAAWVVYVRSATDWDAQRAAFVSGPMGLRLARCLYGLAMIPFGIAHFSYPKETASLVPGWLPWHLFWAYFFGVTFLLAGAAILTKRFAKPAIALSAFQIGLFTVFAWFPVIATGPRTAFAVSETILSIALTIAASVVAESFTKDPASKRVQSRTLK